MYIDPRAEIRGLDEIKAARAAYGRLKSAVASLPPAFHSMNGTPEQTRLQILTELAEKGCGADLKSLKEAIREASAFPQALVLSYKHYGDGSKISDEQHTIYTPGTELGRRVQEIEKALATLCATVKSANKVCRIADELEKAVKECEPRHGGGMSTFHFTASTFDSTRISKLNHAQNALQQATSSLESEVARMLHSSDLESQNGTLKFIADNWKAAPPAEANKTDGDLKIVLGESQRRNTVLVVQRDGEARPVTVPDQQAEFLRRLSTNDSTTEDRAVKARLIGNVSELQTLIHEADWPQGVEKEHNKAAYRLDPSMRGRITHAKNSAGKNPQDASEALS